MNIDPIRLRPELLAGPNPLIEEAPPFVPFKDLPKHLNCYPLESHPDWRRIEAPMREPLLEFSKRHFAASAESLEPAAGMQMLIRAALCTLNPLDPQEQKLVNSMVNVDTFKQVRTLGQKDGGGAIWDGSTAMGKTCLARRALQVFLPKQVHDFGKVDGSGMARLVQCSYLYIDQPSNGTRGGLLKRILLALDEAVGTGFSDKYAKVSNLDTLLVAVCKSLVIYRVALIVIDENQRRNFDESPWQLEFVLFYLSLMNLGISVVLIGNPAAFVHLELFAQVMRRFSVGGKFSFLPAENKAVTWWDKGFVPRMRKFSVVESCTVPESERAELEFEASGGAPGLYTRYVIEVQRAALRRGGETAEISTNDFIAAKRSPRYVEALKIASNMLGGGDDYQDIDLPRTPRGRTPSDETTGTREGPLSPSPGPSRIPADVVVGMMSRFKNEQTRKVNTLAKQLETLHGLSQDDLRALGATEEHIAQAKAMHLKSLETKGSDRARPRKA